MPQPRLCTLVAIAAFTLTGAACGSPSPDGIDVALAPEVISSAEGSVHVSGVVVAAEKTLSNRSVAISVDYTDRNDTTHDIPDVEVTTDSRGAFEAVFTGLDWQGQGTVTAEVLDKAGGVPVMIDGVPLGGTATFSVLDQTPPTALIQPPNATLHVVQGSDFNVDVDVSDEIGVSQVTLEADGQLERARTSVVASGAGTATVTFQMQVPDQANPGQTITLYALVTDLSGNQAAAVPVVLTVDAAP